MLETQVDVRVPAQVSSLTDALRMISLTLPIHCAVVEFESGSIERFCADFIALGKFTRILLIGDFMQMQELEALRPIVAGVLSNGSSSGAVIEAIRRISSGQTWEDLPHLDGSVILPHTRYSPVFTERQQMVLHLVCDGLSNKQCAHVLKVSPSSIKCTIQQLFVKTKAGSRSLLVRYAMENQMHTAAHPFRINAEVVESLKHHEAERKAPGFAREVGAGQELEPGLSAPVNHNSADTKAGGSINLRSGRA
jgi:DNA-binding NarL/FixJ family response regulator